MSETFERITSDQIADQPGHVYRYRFACNWITDGMSVVDVACGVGYGANIVSENRKVTYVGVDKIRPEKQYESLGRFVSGVDLNSFVLTEDFDVALCFETLEHLESPSHLAEQLMAHSKRIVVSVPTQPTKHINPYHLHDFTVLDIQKMFAQCDLIYIEEQPDELSHIFVFEVADA